MWLIVVAGLFVFILYLLSLSVKSLKYWEEKGVPYIIKPLPFFGNFAPALFRRKAFTNLIQEFYNAYPDNRCVGMYQFQLPILLIRDPELIKQITVKDFNTFPEHRQFIAENVDPLWNKNLFAMKGGQRWHDLRATLSPSFTSSKMRMMFGLMKDCSKQFTNHFEKQDGTDIEMKDVFTRFTNDVIATTAFGVSCDSLKNPSNEFYLMGKNATDFGGLSGLRILLSSVCRTFAKLFKVGLFSKSVDTFFRRLITETLQVREKNEIVRPDMIYLLMEARKGRLKNEATSGGVVDSGFAVVQELITEEDSKRAKIELTDEDITAQALMFFVAGFDTASTFMCFTAYELAVNPDIQEKLRKEVDETLENCQGDFTYEALLGMKYLDMVVSESLRKWPPTMVTDRYPIRPYTIEPELPGEQSIPLNKGTNVWIPIYALHRDPKYYPNPENFDPERFSEGNKDSIKPYTYLPFGAGPRSCIGSRFVLLEGKLVIAEILSKFEIVPVAKTQIPLQFHKGNMNPSPEKGFWLGFKSRSKK